jgi:hypothetical protein
MFPPGKTFETLIQGAPEAEYSADGAIDPAAVYASLDATDDTCRMTLAAPSASNGMIRKLIIIEALNVDNTCDVDYTDASGAQTKTFSAVGDVLCLLGTKSGVWKKVF